MNKQSQLHTDTNKQPGKACYRRTPINKHIRNKGNEKMLSGEDHILITAGKIYQWMLKSVNESFEVKHDIGRVLKISVCVLVAQSCPTLRDPMDCSLLGSSVHGILQARLLGWVAIPFSKGSSSPPRD